MKKSAINLSTEDAIVFQHISESGEDDVVSLASSLGMQKGRVMASINSLRKKGLVVVQRTAEDWWVHVSQRGKQVSQCVWPELQPNSAF